MARIVGELDLGQIPDEQYKSDLDLRVAVVHAGSILGSSVVKAGGAKQRRLPFDVEFDPAVLPGGRLPCPVTFIAGPNLADRELLSIDGVKQVIEFDVAKTRSGAKTETLKAAELKLGRIVVEPAIYYCWLFCCRTYTINGRIVCRHWYYDPKRHRWTFCDEPVPGALVEAYDVDRFWWWYWRDLITSATTDINGNFHMRFRWCCLRRLPWPPRPNPTIDPDILARIQQLLATVQPPLPPIPPGPDPDPTLFQQLLGGAASLPGQVLAAATHGAVSLPALQPPAGTVSADAMRAALPPAPELAALRVWPWWEWDDCAPDVVFRATQRCGDRFSVIVSETNAQTRWDIPTTLNVTLIANELACCIPTCHDPECPECLKLTWVGCTPVDQISADAGPPDLRGYARTGASAADPWKDNPFYGSLQMQGGVGWDVDYFKVQVSKDGAPWADLASPAFGGYTRSYWDGSTFVPVAFTPTLKNGQLVIVTRHHYEKLNPGIPRFGGQVIWNDYATLFYFDTTQPGLTPDGLYQLQFGGFAADAADNLIASSERILPACGEDTAERVYLRIDNQALTHPGPTLPAPCKIAHACGGIIHACTVEPDCWIREIWKNEGLPGQECVSACDIARLGPTDTLTIHFSVTCPATVQDGHLGGYWLRAEYGANQAFYIAAPLYVDATGGVGALSADPTAEFGPSYSQALGQGASRAHWHGGDFKVTLHGSDFPECCAYLFRLWAWKRTTNGCADPSVTHYNQFELSFTVLRPDLCPGVCPPPHATGGGD